MAKTHENLCENPLILMSANLSSIAEWLEFSVHCFIVIVRKLYCYCCAIVNYTRGFLLPTL